MLKGGEKRRACKSHPIHSTIPNLFHHADYKSYNWRKEDGTRFEMLDRPSFLGGELKESLPGNAVGTYKSRKVREGSAGAECTGR